jgi:hypothetical protein
VKKKICIVIAVLLLIAATVLTAVGHETGNRTLVLISVMLFPGGGGTGAVT